MLQASQGTRLFIYDVDSAMLICLLIWYKFVYKVYVLAKDKKKYYYIWQIEKVELEGEFKNCWMTTAVSDPIYLGETI